MTLPPSSSEAEDQSTYADRNHGYTIRPAQADDVDRLVELLLGLQNHLEASNPDVWRIDPQARAHFGSQVTARLRLPDTCVLVAEHVNDGVVGVISGRIITNKRYIPDRTGMVDQIFVDERHRRAGVGSQLVAQLCHFFGEQGIDDLSLRYVAGNEEATCFWADLGFVPRISIVGAKRQAVEKHLARTRGA